MKAFLPIIALLAAPVALTSIGYADETPGELTGILPADGTLKPGAAVRPVFTPEFGKMQEKLSAKLNELSEEQRKAFLEDFNPLELPAYNKDIWPDKASYDAYKAEWKKVAIQPVTEVAVGLKGDGTSVWRVLSATVDAQSRKTVPLTISALSYDAARNVWISNNGELKASEYKATEDNVFGAQTGTEWKLEKEDSLSKLIEVVRVTKTTDGKSIYVTYNFSERSVISPVTIAQGAYTLRFAAGNAKVNMGTPGSR